MRTNGKMFYGMIIVLFFLTFGIAMGAEEKRPYKIGCVF